MAQDTGLKYSKLSDGGVADFTQMIQRFGVVTVMNARVYDTAEFLNKGNLDGSGERSFDTYYAQGSTGTTGNAADIAEWFLTKGTEICFLDTLTTANVNVEGPSKTISGGQYTNPLIKFGKTATLEIQDALGDARAIEALCGGLIESDAAPTAQNPYKAGANNIGAFHYGGDFEGPKTIIGESFFIDQSSGKQVPVTIIFYQFLPDSVFNLTQASDGDATVFDMNGSLLNTEIMISTTKANTPIKHGLFYSVLPRITAAPAQEYTINNNVIEFAPIEGKTIKADGVIANGTPVTAGNTITATGSIDSTGDVPVAKVTVTTSGADPEPATVDVVIFFEDGGMATYNNIAITAAIE